MAPKRQSSTPSSSTPNRTGTSTPTLASTTSSTTTTVPSSSSSLPPKSSPAAIAQHVWTQYLANTPSRTKLLDAFMAYLVLIGGLQFVYCVLAGNYPFNAFLSGFSAAVGQFVLTASLRMQTVERAPTSGGQGKKITGQKGELGEGDRGGISSERAFADYVFGSLVLHAFCVNFIN
ncbi:MAG: hypothetical protein Q9227_009163 [Pyrenula ochraceoflavens]